MFLLIRQTLVRLPLARFRLKVQILLLFQLLMLTHRKSLLPGLVSSELIAQQNDFQDGGLSIGICFVEFITVAGVFLLCDAVIFRI
jgi:hypothetical protein